MRAAGNRLLGVAAFAIGLPLQIEAQEAERCLVLCAPELKVEPTLTFENLGKRARLESGGAVSESGPETVFEIVVALDVPTQMPRVGLTLEAIVTPFKGTEEQPFSGRTAAELGVDEIRDNAVELEGELNVYLVQEDETGGWLSSHFDVVDQFSPGERPNATSTYTHKLDLELDTAVRPFGWLAEGHWLRNAETEVSLDYLATGRPRAGDMIGDELFLDDASPWSLSLVLVLPLAPFRP